MGKTSLDANTVAQVAKAAVQAAAMVSKPKKTIQKPKPSNKPTSRLVKGIGGGSFEAALLAPFSSAAEGAQIPDMYSFPTETTHLHTSFKVKSGTDGNFDATIFPHPLYTLISASGSISGGSAVTVEGGGLPSGLTYLGACSPDALSARYDDYRVVGGGIRIKFINSFNNCNGKLYYAAKPSSSMALSATSVDSSGNPPSKSQCYSYLDLPYDGSRLPVSILNLPMGKQTTMSALMENGALEIPFKIVSADFSRFRDATDSDRGPVLVTENELTDGISNKVSESYIDMSGWSCIMLRGQGLSILDGSTGLDVLEIEVIYHLEGTPALATSGTYLVGGVKKPAVNIASMWNTIQKAAGSPVGKFVVEAAGTAVPGLDRAARVLGLYRG